MAETASSRVSKDRSHDSLDADSAAYAKGNGMASEASWQTGEADRIDPSLPDRPMDQQTVECLLRRLVERVEESERRYSEALDELHSRLDHLAQTADAAKTAGSPESPDTFQRLHDQVSGLARRYDHAAETPLDDFERLGKALSEGMGLAAAHADYPFPPAPRAPEPEPVAAPSSHLPDFSFPGPDASDPVFSPGEDKTGDLDRRLVEMANRLEQSISAAMPTATLETVNTRLDVIGNQLGRALDQAPKADTLEQVERHLSDMGQQLGRAELELTKIGGIERELHRLIERVDTPPQGMPAELDPAKLETVASKAAAEAAKQAAKELASGNAERLETMQRDLMAMNETTRDSDHRLATTLTAVHDSLKQLVQQVERGLPPNPPRSPFVERARPEQGPAPQIQAGMDRSRPPAEAQETQGAAGSRDAKTGHPDKDRSLRSRLGATMPRTKEDEPAPSFGRAARGPMDREAMDLDAPAPGSGRQQKGPEAEFGTPDDLVAAARRAAQAAALRAEERASARGRRTSPLLAGSGLADADGPRRKRSVLIIAAAVLLALSAVLLYGRLRSKPEPEVIPPAVEQSAPAPESRVAPAPAPGPEGEGHTSSQGSGAAIPPDQWGSWPIPESETSPANSAVIQEDETSGFAEVVKSSRRASTLPASELVPEPQLASLKPVTTAALPPGVSFSIEDPTARATSQAAPSSAAQPLPASLPLPPAELGPLALRQAAAAGDAKAQHLIGLRYAEGEGTPRDLSEAARWLERAASAGLAPAQYRLGAMYERGLGVDKDLARAKSWYSAAAEKGNVKAMHNLAVAASGREGSKADYALASRWYQEAAAYGLADSQFNLGILAEHGLGQAKDLSEAYKWFALAAAQGDSEAAKRRDQLKVRQDTQALAQAEQAAKVWTAQEADREANEVAGPAEWAATSAGEPNQALVTRARTCSTTSATTSARPMVFSANARGRPSRASSAALASRNRARSRFRSSPSSNA